jgi:hypothetical protein
MAKLEFTSIATPIFHNYKLDEAVNTRPTCFEINDSKNKVL